MLFFKAKRNKQISTFDSSDVVDLLLIREKYNEYTELYFRENGVSITKYFKDFDDIEIALMMGSEKVRLVIVEEGLGDFITMANRKRINSLLGMCDGKDKKALIFYINPLLMSDNKMYKHVDYKKFTSTQDIVEVMKALGEIYTDMVDNEISLEEKVKQAMYFKGEYTEVEDAPYLHTENKCLTDIMANRYNIQNELESFNVKY
jgi:hypothetical protein